MATLMTIDMDLSRTDIEIHRDLRARWPRDPFMWWDLADDGLSGTVYSREDAIARLVHDPSRPA